MSAYALSLNPHSQFSCTLKLATNVGNGCGKLTGPTEPNFETFELPGHLIQDPLVLGPGLVGGVAGPQAPELRQELGQELEERR